MNLTYKILWADDDSDWADSIKDSIKNFVEENGFEFSVKMISGKEQDFIYKDFDLILMDYNLDNSTGDEIIKEVRDLKILTDVVFYSANKMEELRNSVIEQGFEGIYYAERERTQFIEKVGRVIQSTIKKVLDLNNLRGLVMAEVSELDFKMEEIIKKYYNTNEKMNVFRAHVIEDREDTLRRSLSCKNECTLKWRNALIDDIVLKIESSQKAHAIHTMLGEIDPNDDRLFFKTYENKILKVRNELAHCVSKKLENGKEILVTREGDVNYNEEKFKQILYDISNYHKFFDDIIKSKI